MSQNSMTTTTQGTPPGTEFPLFPEEQWEQVADALSLSPRENEVMLGLFNDLCEAGIAYRLGLSRYTVHTYIERLYRKLGVNSRTAFLLRIVQEHLRMIRASGSRAHT